MLCFLSYFCHFVFGWSAKVFEKIRKSSLIFGGPRVSLCVSGLTADHYFWCSRVFLAVLRVFRDIMGCSRVLWDVPGAFRGCSGLFRGCSGDVAGCSGGVPGCSGAALGFTDTPKYLSCLVYGQPKSGLQYVCFYLVSLFVFISAKNWGKYSEIPARSTCHESRGSAITWSRLRYITGHTGRPSQLRIISELWKNSICNVHVLGMPLEWAGNLKFSYFAVLTIADLWSPNVPNSIH